MEVSLVCTQRVSVRIRYVSTKTDNAFCSAAEQAVGKPLVTGSNPVCANRKSIVRVEISKVSFIFWAISSTGRASVRQTEGYGFDLHMCPLNFAICKLQVQEIKNYI